MSYKFEPDWRSPPGDTILEMLETRGLSADDAAANLGLSLEDVGRLFAGDLVISSDLAAKLSVYLGASQQFWLNRDAQFREPVPLKRS